MNNDFITRKEYEEALEKLRNEILLLKEDLKTSLDQIRFNINNKSSFSLPPMYGPKNDNKYREKLRKFEEKLKKDTKKENE